ncbi:two-component sensor histidine kinase [Arthrobacter sp. MYb23]|uniref:sensor histidine kinase n=1 Tax=unclassified Arthrobacter TaxID=235627 RepID=UPI000CFC461C|nr:MULTISPECIES: HAMP domain-containing sensor histidine kinase [unclassified Arthrobacter]PRB38975.1 two-component sensor histidine kinase [Arthrobacter sp. MYb51]PRB92981.1 two-component sensor histidine kinase [Arthrobacter sp. MYb23]
MTLVIAAAITLTVLVFAVLVYALVGHELRTNEDLSLRRESDRIIQLIQTDPNWQGFSQCTWVRSPACAQIVAPTPAEDPDAGDGPALPITGQMREVASGGSAAFFTEATIGEDPIRVYVRPLSNQRALVVGVRDDRVLASFERLGWLLAATVLGALVVAAGTAYVAARRGLRPVDRLTAVAEGIAQTGDTHIRIPRSSTTEIDRLGIAFNTMLGELEQSRRQQEQLIADASHELRTPLTSLRTNAAMLKNPDLEQKSRERITGALEHELMGMQSLVEDLIDLARHDEAPSFVEDMDLNELVLYCLENAQRRYPGIEWSLDGSPQQLLVTGERARLARAIANLLDNAGKFTPEPGQVRLSLTVSEGSVTLDVRDTGPGIPAQDLAHVFDRFYRSTTARSVAGSGLGLAVVHNIALAHHGTATAHPSPSGAHLSLTLPLAGAN